MKIFKKTFSYCVLLAAAISSFGQTVTIQPLSQTVPVGGSATFTTTVTGAGPFTYQWQFNGTSLPNGIISTVAGGGSGGLGDGGTATNAALYRPFGVAWDAAGDFFIADYFGERVRKVDTFGLITTFAGDGNPTYSGDGGSATSAGVYSPCGVAASASGNLYIADNSDNRIRGVDTNGIITTVAGNGSPGYSGDSGAATNAGLNYPTGVTFDSTGNMLIADYGNNLVRNVDTNGIITTFAGNGSGGYAGDGGAAVDASLNQPAGVGVDSSGNLFIADASNGRIREVQNTAYPSLTIYDVTPDNAGNYTVIVSGSFGSVTSSVAVLQVTTNFPVDIVQQPTNETVYRGGTASFSVTATGTMPLSYQWLFDGASLSGATNAILSLPGVTTNLAGRYSVVVSNFLGSVTSLVATLTVVFPPAGFQVANTNGTAGGLITVPVLVVANGNENAFGFSLSFSTNKLMYSGTALGSGASGANISVNSSQTNGGKVGLLVTLPANTTLAAGTQQVAQVSFLAAVSTNASVTAISFGDLPTPRQLYDNQLNSLPATYSNGLVSIAPVAYEGDVFPRPNGDGYVTLGDVLQIARYVARLDYPTNGSEYQRADCAPRSTLGNGAITVADWVQVGRYAAAFDTPTVAGGPTNDITGPGAGPSANRLVALVGTAISQSQTGTVSITLTAQGTENALGFSVAFNPAELSFLGATPGSDAGGASLYVNANQAAAGQLGFALALGTGNSFSAGTRQVVVLTFRASASSSGNLPVSFADQPVPREVADALANALPVSYINGTITGSPPPVLGIARSGQNVTLSWPLWASNFQLQAASGALRSPLVWTNVPGAAGISNSQNVITLPRSSRPNFYRLFYP